VNKVKQLAIGLHNYHDTFKKLPRFANISYGPNATVVAGVPSTQIASQWEGFSAHTMLLPYIEQQQLWDDFLKDYGTCPDLFEGWRNPAGGGFFLAVRRTAVPAFRCPSDPGMRFGADAGNNNYAVCTGPSYACWSAARQLGVFSRDFETNFADITDGTSNTIMLGEQLVGDNNANLYTPGDVVRAIAWTGAVAFPTETQLSAYGQACAAAVISNPTNIHQHNGREWICTLPTQTIFNTIAPPNWQYPSCQNCVGCGWMDSDGVFPARSRHPGGANHGLVDGSVRFISNDVNTLTYQYLGSKDRGEAIPSY
jgi:hypothetical protein